MSLGSRPFPDVPADRVLLVPWGSTEQHGPHLPLDTDTRIAVAVCDLVARRRDDVVVAPAVAYGSSGEHAGFPGTLSIGQAATELVALELGRSADDFAGVVFVSGHAGNVEPLRAATARLRDEGRSAHAWFPVVPGGDAHAGVTETSLMLHLAPELVRLDVAEAGNTEPIGDLLDRLRAGGVRSVAPNGVLGDPAGADAETGGWLLDQLATDVMELVDRVVGDGAA